MPGYDRNERRVSILMADKEFLDVVAFIENHKGEKKPKTLGYAYRKENGDVQIQLDTVPAHGWTGGIVVQPRREKEAF